MAKVAEPESKLCSLGQRRNSFKQSTMDWASHAPGVPQLASLLPCWAPAAAEGSVPPRSGLLLAWQCNGSTKAMQSCGVHSGQHSTCHPAANSNCEHYGQRLNAFSASSCYRLGQPSASFFPWRSASLPPGRRSAAVGNNCLFWSSDLFHQQFQGAGYSFKWSLFDFQGYLHFKPLFWKPSDVY